MKYAIGTILLLLTLLNSNAQSNSSNTITPPVVPTPIDTSCKEDAKLISFSLPVCVSETKRVRAIGSWAFDKPQCNKPPISFDPIEVGPSKVNSLTHFNVTATAGGISLIALTTGVNENISSGFTPLVVNLDNLGKTIDNMMQALGNGGVSPCKPSGAAVPTVTLGYESVNLCCASGILPAKKYTGSLSWSYGTTCHVPIFGCPYVASLDLVASASASFTLAISLKATCVEQKKCVSGNGSFSIGGGVGATLLAGFVSADLQFTAGASLGGEYCFSPEPREGVVNITAGPGTITGTVSEFWGLFSHSVSYVVFDGWQLPPYKF